MEAASGGQETTTNTPLSTKKDRSRFMELPVELRQCIYEYVFALTLAVYQDGRYAYVTHLDPQRPGIHIGGGQTRINKYRALLAMFQDKGPQLLTVPNYNAMLAVSKTVYQETVRQFYETTTFVIFDSEGYLPRPDWPGPLTQNVRKLAFDLSFLDLHRQWPRLPNVKEVVLQARFTRPDDEPAYQSLGISRDPITHYPLEHPVPEALRKAYFTRKIIVGSVFAQSETGPHGPLIVRLRKSFAPQSRVRMDFTYTILARCYRCRNPNKISLKGQYDIKEKRLKLQSVTLCGVFLCTIDDFIPRPPPFQDDTDDDDDDYGDDEDDENDDDDEDDADNADDYLSAFQELPGIMLSDDSDYDDDEEEEDHTDDYLSAFLELSQMMLTDDSDNNNDIDDNDSYAGQSKSDVE